MRPVECLINCTHFFCFCFIVVIWSIHSVYMRSICPDPSELLHWLEAARLDCIVYWYFHGHLQNRLIYSIVIVWLYIILLLQTLLPPWYLLNSGGLHDSGFSFNKGLQTLWTVPTSVYAIDIELLYCIPMWIYWINVSESCMLNPWMI